MGGVAGSRAFAVFEQSEALLDDLPAGGVSVILWEF
jgi:hypothetical protein